MVIAILNNNVICKESDSKVDSLIKFISLDFEKPTPAGWTLTGEGVVSDWFSIPHEFKSIDSVYANEKDIQHLFKLPAYFDAVIFLDVTTATRPNPSSPIPRLLY
jgi:hypothetical protein